MAHFYGEVKGSRGEAHRLGTKNSGLRSVSASWQGAVEVYLSYDTTTGKDIASVFLTPWRGKGCKQTLFVGPVDGEENKPRENHEQEQFNEPIGILVNGDTVTCFECETLGEHKVPLYHVNVYPYRQTCAKCGKVLVQPRTSSWPELFTGTV